MIKILITFLTCVSNINRRTHTFPICVVANATIFTATTQTPTNNYLKNSIFKQKKILIIYFQNGILQALHCDPLKPLLQLHDPNLLHDPPFKQEKGPLAKQLQF